MKKIILLSFLFLLIPINISALNAEEYTNYQEVIFEDDAVELLKEFNSKDYKKYYKKTKRRKMFGWRIHVVNKNEKLDYIAETKIKIFNSGTTPIDYQIKLETKEETKRQISASGSIKVTGSGKSKKFKGSVDANIKASITTTEINTRKESFKFDIKVDPLTYVSIVTRGTGEINNGVGSYYFFWTKTKKGGWETFTVLTEYYEIVKARFW
ncbi:MAG: hypothetical protein K9L64_00370 [Candidatus Izimaplasma sp.]|nr:hypothetical protein [Candidatus Izimaplasma bacterium]